MRFNRLIHVTHNWLGLILAIQVILWMASGVVMSVFAIEHVRGETAAAFSAPVELKVHNYYPPAGVIAEVDGARDVTLRAWQGREVYVVSGAAGKAMFDADSGEKLSPLTEADVRRVAESDFIGEGEIERLALIHDPPQEFRRPGPVWRAEFSDADETRLYISPETGEVLARRNRVWRFYDFFWMLHIMDYKEREDFNSPLLQIFSVTGLLFALTGVTLVFFRLQNGRYADELRRGAAAPFAKKKSPPERASSDANVDSQNAR